MKKKQLNFKLTIILCCLIPMIVGIATSLVITLTKASSELVEANKVAVMALTKGTGEGLDDHINATEEMMKAFASSAEVKNYLKNSSNIELQKECQKYTEDFFSNLEGWEGLYVADWNSKVMTHSTNPAVVGVTLREGEELINLQENMIAGEKGFYNAGVITSPASGELTFSMYCAVYDGDKPIGYVGGGTFLKEAIAKYSDVSSLKLDSAYLYAVDADGIMLFHKDESKIGNPVENEVVKGLVADIQGGQHPSPDVVVYKYKGADKIAGYYVDKGNNFISVITCDKSDALKTTKQLLMVCIPVACILMIFFILIAFVIAKAITKPLGQIVKVTEDLADGNLNTNTDISSIEKETNQLVEAVKTLQHNLKDIVYNIRTTSNNLSTNVVETNSLCSSSDDGAKQISGAVDELARATQSMAESVQSLAMDMGDIANSIDTINNATGELKQTTDVIEKVSDKAKNDIVSVAESAKSSVEAVNDINSHMTELANAISEINTATELISSISSQTALLSLNASIEAARAGEAGKGFAVVAGEISKLAEQSNEGTTKIDEVTKTLLNLSERSLNITKKVTDVIKDEQKKVKDTENSFLKLKEQIDISLNQIDSIAADIEVLNKAKDNANMAVQDLSAISEENAASNEEVTASVSSLATNISDIAGRSNGLEEMSTNLQNVIKVFK